MFTKEDNVGLDRRGTFGTTQDGLVANRLLHGIVRMLQLALGAGSSSVSAVALDDSIHVHSSLLLEIVDILSHALPHHALFLQHFDEVVRWRRIAGAQVKVLRKFVEGLWLVDEVVESKDTFGLRQIVLRQIVVNSGAG